MATLSKKAPPRRLPASSLLEVVVATTILVLVFGLALASLTRLTLTGPRQRQLRGQQLVAHAAAVTIREQAWHARTWREAGFELTQEVTLSPATPTLLTLRITAEAAGQSVAQLQQLVYVPPPVPAAP